MNEYVLAPKARLNLIQIHDFIARDNPDAAADFLRLLEEKFDLLAQSPGIGRKRPEIHPAIRSHPVGNYVVFYREKREGIEIVGVMHGSRDYLRLFRKR